MAGAVKTARRVAVEGLMKVNAEGGFSNIVVDHLLSAQQLSAADRAFATALFYGVIERRLTLDYQLSPYLKLPISHLDAAVREVLRLGAYQLFYLPLVPDSAAVNESVKLIKELKMPYVSGMVNAVLRSIIRDGKQIRLPDIREDKVGHYSVKYSCSRSIVTLWLTAYGDRAIELLERSVDRPPLYIRVNPLKTDVETLLAKLGEEKVKAKRHPLLPYCLEVQSSKSLKQTQAFAEGLFHVQDVSSQLCAEALGAQPGERVFDICAAPGGKSFTVAEQMENRGEVVAMDLYSSRLKLVQSGRDRLGLTVVNTEKNDGALFNAALGTADRVMCDAVCSGFGVIRRKPEIRYKEMEEVAELPEIQYQLLSTSAGYVRVGGVLQYSTCTLNPAENEAVAERFLREHPAFSPLALPEVLQPVKKTAEDYSATLFGDVYGGDGFFIATFVRKKED